MKRSITIARIRGVPVQVHWTFPLLFLFFWGVLFLLDSPLILYLHVAVVTLVIFLFVFLHELAHVTTARAFGIRTRSITLFPLGGLSMLERLPERPAHEALVAFAGPMLNIVAALLLVPLVMHYHGVAALTRLHFIDLTDASWGGSLAQWVLTLFWMNVILGGFNLLPAIPLDGGRVMRAGLATRISYASATRIAALVGRTFAIGFVIIGLFWNPFLALIGIFVFFGASTEERSAQLMRLFSRLRVADAMTHGIPEVRPWTSHEELVRMRDPARPTHVAVTEDGAFQGIIPPETLRFLQPVHERDALAIASMPPTVRAEDDLSVPLRHFAGGQVDVVAVTAPGTEGTDMPRFLGILTTEDMESAYRHLRRAELEARAARRRRRDMRRGRIPDVPIAEARPARGGPGDDVERWIPERPDGRR